MLREVYKVDDNGYIIDNYVGEFDEEGNLVSPEGDFVTESLPQPLHFFQPRWNGEEWEEGETEDMRAVREMHALEMSLEPDPDVVRDAMLEIKILNLLTDLEVL